MNGLDVLSNVSRVSKEELKDIWKNVKKNHELLESCSKHDFQLIDEKRNDQYQGRCFKYRCTRCQGELDSINVSWYKKGLEHSKQ